MQKLLNIGHVNLLLRSEYERFWYYADRRYENFYVDVIGGEPDETIDVHVVAAHEAAAQQGGSASIHFKNDGKTVEIARGRGTATWDRAGQYCKVKQSQNDFLPQNKHADYVVDSIIRIMLSVRLLEQESCLIHSAGLIEKDKGYLFVGQSGAGKSTVSRVSAAATVLSDDLTLLRLNGKGSQICGTPFYGEFGSEGTRICAPLEGIFFLRHAELNGLKPLPTGTGVRRLLRSIMHFDKEVGSTNKILKLAQKICVETPCYTLDFLPDDSFWRLIHD